MVKLRRLFFAILIFAVAPVIFHSAAQQPSSQPAKPSQPDPIAALLELPAPLPESAYDYADPWERDKKTPIPDEQSPLEQLYKYWTRPGLPLSNRTQLSDKVRYRLFEAVEEDTERLYRILLFDLAPDTPETHDRIKVMLDKRPSLPVNWSKPDQSKLSPDQYQEFSWQQTVREWLMKHSRYFRDELVQQASQLYEAEGMIHNEGVLETLARMDWERAKPVLEMHATSNSPRRAALSLAIQFKHAIETADTTLVESLRERLQKIVRDKQANAYARHKAAEALLKTAWPGRDEFYLSLFSEGSFVNLSEGRYSLNTLATLLKEDIAKWLPVITQLIGNPNRAIHDSAVSALLQLDLWNPRREVLLPLLPWLSDPNWSSAGNGYTREQLVQSFGRTQVPEAVPYLITILEGNETNLHRWAARALSSYRAPEAGPALKKIGAKAAGFERGEYTYALIKCDALTNEEKLSYLELYASKVQRLNADYGLDYSLVGGDFDSFDWSIGSSLSREEDAPSQLAFALLERVKVLQKENPRLATNLLLVVQRWPVPAVFSNLVERIGNGTADRFALGQALQHREELRVSSGGVLQALIGKGGRTAGIAAALLGDDSIQKAVLEGKDRAAQTSLLACARLLRDPLPVELVGSLYEVKDQLLQKATDLYLASVDTVEARRLLLAHHPGEALITGSRGFFAPQKKDALSKWEETLRDEIRRKEGSEEIFAVAVEGHERIHQSLVIRVNRDKAIAIKAKDESRDETRELSKSELQKIQDTFDAVDFDNLTPRIFVPPPDTHYVGLQSTEFIHLIPSGGRAVLTNTVSQRSAEKTVYQRLYRLFSDLSQSAGFRLRYKMEDHIKGVEVLYADEKNPAQNVCSQGRQIRVLVKEEITDQQEKTLQSRDFNEPYDWHWRLLQNGKLAETAGEPALCQITKNNEEYDKEISGNRDETFQRPWQLRTGDETIRVGYLKNTHTSIRGVWRLKPGQTPELISEIYCGWPLVTKDGRWLIVNQFGESSKKTSNIIVRFDLRTNQAFPTNLSSKEYLQPIAELSGKILIARSESSLPRAITGEFYLLDPAAGASQPVKGEFRPMQQQTFRPLQPANGSAEYWAAIPDEKLNQTSVGLYDARKFAFTPLLELPEIRFDSMQMWVDEAAGKVYVAYNGHLLRLPLPQRTKP